jgi:hypothetical protein
MTHSAPQTLPSHGGIGGGGEQSFSVSGAHAPAPSHARGAGQGAPLGHGASHRTPHGFPAHVSTGAQTNVPAVTHSPRALHAVGANVGTGHEEAGVPGGQ